MANHGVGAFIRMAPVDIAIAASHRSGFLAQIGSQNIEDRLTEGEPAGLISNQRSKSVARSQHYPNRHAHRFLTSAQITTSSDLSGVPQGGNFVFDGSRQQHPFECTDV